MSGEFEPQSAETAFICTSCRMEYTARYERTTCGDCGGELVDRTGTRILPQDSDLVDEVDEFDDGSWEGSMRSRPGSVVSVLEPHESSNPFLARLFAHPLFGYVSERVLVLIDNLETADPDERVISAIRVRHGPRESGFLIVTTKWLRYIKAGRLVNAILKDDTYWDLGWELEFEGRMGVQGLLRTASGDQFQVASRGRAKGFLSLYRLVQEAMAWESQQVVNAQAQASGETPGSTEGSRDLAAQLTELSLLHKQGDLSDDEFETAKRRLLQGGA